MQELLSGNEAIALGAYESGVRVAAAYPGTPSTEILENIGRYPEIMAQWSPNEKVALEVGIGASLVGARALVAMKHVGLNVAADPLMTLAYTGVNAGLVIVSADDPGIHSSQNEQDTRFYGRFARVPVLEPADSAEARDFVGIALDLSEQLDTVVILRSTTRISHSKSLLQPGSREDRALRRYEKNVRKYVMVPGHARLHQPEVLARQARIEEWVETAAINRIEWRDRRIGIVTAGVSYQYVREACPDASVLKLGATYPVPARLLREFAAGVERVVVVEELEPFLAEQARLAGVDVQPSGLPRVGELSPAAVAAALGGSAGPAATPAASTPAAPATATEASAPAMPEQVPAASTSATPAQVPARPPVMCPGCPHRAVFSVLARLRLLVTGDIGCYTLGALPPQSAMDIFMDMGASIGMALGAEKGDPARVGRIVAVIGDSTFLHSGITGLMDMLYNNSHGTVVILDNGTTAMTGHQDHPATGRTLQGAKAPVIDLEMIVRGLGVERVKVVDPFDPRGVERVLRAELAAPEVSVVIARGPCVFVTDTRGKPVSCESQECRECKLCTRLGCPALHWGDGHPEIDRSMCGGCQLCATLCPFGALHAGGADA